MKKTNVCSATRQLTGDAMKKIRGGNGLPSAQWYVVCTVADWGCFYTMEDCQAGCAFSWACRDHMVGCPVGMP